MSRAEHEGEGVRSPQSPSLSNWIAALSIRKRVCEEPISPFLSELPPDLRKAGELVAGETTAP